MSSSTVATESTPVSLVTSARPASSGSARRNGEASTGRAVGAVTLILANASTKWSGSTRIRDFPISTTPDRC